MYKPVLYRDLHMQRRSFIYQIIGFDALSSINLTFFVLKENGASEDRHTDI